MPSFPADRLSRLTLGTVQIGLPYGKVAPSLPPDEGESAALLDAAWAGGITCFDTARGYGEAERRIGRWRAGRDSVAGSGDAGGGGGPLIVSKLTVMNDTPDEDAAAFVRLELGKSCAALGVSKIDGYLVHRAADLHRPGVAAALSALVEEGRIGAFGASIYTVEDAKRALDVPGIGLLQGPLSVFDRRLVDAGIVDRCNALGVAFFGRSVFLQGLVFTDPPALPPHFAAARDPLARLRGVAHELGAPLAALALAAARASIGDGIDSLVVGVANLGELSDILAADTVEIPPDAVAAAWAAGRTLGPDILDPRRWP